MQNHFSRSMCFLLIRLDLALHIVPQIRYLGFTLKGRRVPWPRRRTCPHVSPSELWYENQQSKPVLAHVQGECAYVQGELLCVLCFALVVCALCLSLFLTRLCWAIALARGDWVFPLLSDLALCLCLAFDCLYEFLLVIFCFPFIFGYKCVCCQCTHQGGIEDLCGSRTGG
jgi:hypothetical protein